MKRLHSKAKQRVMVTHDVAPMPPIDTRKHCHHAVLPIASIANSFFRGCRGDAIGHRFAPLAVLSVSLMLFVTIHPVYSQTSDPMPKERDAAIQENAAEVDDRAQAVKNGGYSVDNASVHDEASVHGTSVDTTNDANSLNEPAFQKNGDYDSEGLDANGTLSADDADIQRIRKFSRYFPPQIRKAIVQSRQANRKGPLMVFRHWAQERKPFVATFLFCMFIGLLGSAFFPNQVSVAQECCRSQFWKCLGKAILVGMTVIVTVRILDLLLIANPLTTLLLALLELAVVAGLSVGVSLIGEGLTRNTLENSDYFKTHPRLATFTKIFLGSLILAIIVQIPGAGLLPRIGIRIALLVAILGAGGLLKTKFGTQREVAE